MLIFECPAGDYLFVLIYPNARTGVRIGEENCKVIGAYWRDTTRISDSSGTSLLWFAADSKLALVNLFFSPHGLHVSYKQWHPARG